MFRSTQSRRDWMRISSSGLIAGSLCRWFPSLAGEALAADSAKRKACILLWMTGGPSQLDTFDPKPGHPNGGEFKPIDTSVPGVQICEHLPKVAQQLQHAAVIRSMSTKEGDHERATYLAHTGYLPQGPIRYPTLGSLFSKELTPSEAELPGFVAIAPSILGRNAYGPGFLGPRYAPLVVGDPRLPQPNPGMEADFRVRNIDLPEGIAVAQADARLGLLDSLEGRFQQTRPATGVDSHRTAYQKAVTMMRSAAVGAFNLDEEPAELRDAYGRTPFGDACLLARRLVERGVSFIEVSLNAAQGNAGIGWDTHQDNFNAVQQLCGVLDPAWAALLDDLQQRGLLDSTLVLWMGEFGRTPEIVAERTGRDHFPVAWSSVICGGGIRGGQVVGRTSADGKEVEERPVSIADYLATVCLALGLDPEHQNMSNVGRPIRLVDPEAKPITEIVG
jgi:hypothetical protein